MIMTRPRQKAIMHLNYNIRSKRIPWKSEVSKLISNLSESWIENIGGSRQPSSFRESGEVALAEDASQG